MGKLHLVSSDFPVLKEIDLRMKEMGLNGLVGQFSIEIHITKTLTRKEDAIHRLRVLKKGFETLIEEFE